MQPADPTPLDLRLEAAKRAGYQGFLDAQKREESEDIDAACEVAIRAWEAAAPAPVGEDELTLRTMLAICYAGPALYRDDGELQDSRSHPFIDFKRDSAREISRKMGERALAALRQPAAVTSPAMPSPDRVEPKPSREHQGQEAHDPQHVRIAAGQLPDVGPGQTEHAGSSLLPAQREARTMPAHFADAGDDHGHRVGG